MKFILSPLLFLSLLFSYSNSQAQKDSTHFVTTWATTVQSFLNDSVIAISTDPNYNYNFDVDWNNDGVFDTLGVKGDVSHRYASFDTVTIRIRGKFPKIYWKLSNQSKFKLLSVDQWGTNYWKSMEQAFYPCEYLQTVSNTDAPRLDSVKSMAQMFRSASNFNDTINHWDVSSVTNMSMMFKGAYSFKHSIGNWDVSSVKDMSYMFQGTHYNQPLNNWDVSSVTTMQAMFYRAVSFNQALNNWDVSSVVNMRGLFVHADLFNQPINDWDVSSVTDMSFMFASTDSFNQPINDWDVSSVTNMKSMFGNAKSFNQSLNKWNVSSVTDMSYMFSAYQPPLSSGGGYTDKSAFNSSIDGWDASLVTTMHRMFYKNDTFNQAINDWDVSSVTDMSRMFQEAEDFNQPLNKWNVSLVTDMNHMFIKAVNFNQPLKNWNTSSVQDMWGMFRYAYAFNQNLMHWNISKVNYMPYVFDSTAMSTANYDSTLISWQLKSHQSNVWFGAAGLEYCASDSARKLLIQDGWSFSGDSKNCTLVGIAEGNEKKALFELYPNPSSGFVFLEVAENKRQFPLQIYNTNGSLLREIRLDQTQNRIDLNEFSDGLYLFRHGKNSEKVLLRR